MIGLNLIGPHKPDSKCWQVLLPLKEGWAGSTINTKYVDDGRPVCFWGLGVNNETAKKCRNKKWLFTDMPYWNRWMGPDTADTCSWRVIPNALHETNIHSYPSDRCKDVQLFDWRKTGDHILVCPSSTTMTMWASNQTESEWIDNTTNELKRYTDRKIVIRRKPRLGKLSGPMVESTPLSQDLLNCWAVVTNCSIVGVQAAILGIPVFCHRLSPAIAVGNTRLMDIENPHMPERQAWVNTLSYRQFSKAELANGFAKEVLHTFL